MPPKQKKNLKQIISTLLLLSVTSGLLAFSLVNYNSKIQVQALTPPTSITTKDGWVGNTNSGVKINAATSWYTSDQITPAISDIDVSPDGTFVSDTFSEEGYQNISTFNPDGSKKKSGYIPGGQDGGHSISTNSKYTFAARMASCSNNATGLNSQGNPSAPNPCDSSQPNSTTNPNDKYVYYTSWYGVERYSNRTDIAPDQNIPATNGLGQFASFIKIQEDTSPFFNRPLNKPYMHISGIYASETEVFISDYVGNKIQVYDVDTLAKKREFTVNKPGKITMDKDGYLWVVSETNFQREKFYRLNNVTPTKIQKFNINGSKQSQEIYNSSLVAGDIAIDSQNRLVVGDLSRNSQVFYYGNINSTPSIVKTVGTAGGIWSGVKGQYGDYKFVDITGVGIDGQDNLIVGMDDYGFMKFNSAGQFQWFKHGTNWKGSGLIDPNNPNVMYSTGYKYEVDWTKPSEQWKVLAKIDDPVTFPNDFKNDQFFTGEFTTPLMNSIKACKINNQTFYITSENTDQTIGFHKFDPASSNGELAIPAGYFYLNRPRAVINPANGSYQEGWFWNSQWDPKPAFEKQMQWWSDNNNDYTKQDNEVSKFTESKYQSLGNNVNLNNSFAREFDDNCNLWIGTPGGIYYLPAGGLNASGNPIYDYNQMQRYNVPTEFPDSGDDKKGLQRFWYDPKTDSAYISGYTNANPNPNPNDYWGWVGSSIARYDNWMSGSSTKVWQKDIPFDVAGAQDWNRLGYSALTQVGDLIFISRSQERTEIPDSPYIMVMRTSDGQRVGSLEVPADQLRNRPDGAKAQRSFKMPNGTYVVSQIDVTRSKIRLWEVTPDVLIPISSSSSSSSISSSAQSISSSVNSSTSSSIASSVLLSVSSTVNSSATSSTSSSAVIISTTSSSVASNSSSSVSTSSSQTLSSSSSSTPSSLASSSSSSNSLPSSVQSSSLIASSSQTPVASSASSVVIQSSSQTSSYLSSSVNTCIYVLPDPCGNSSSTSSISSVVSSSQTPSSIVSSSSSMSSSSQTPVVSSQSSSSSSIVIQSSSLTSSSLSSLVQSSSSVVSSSSSSVVSQSQTPVASTLSSLSRSSSSLQSSSQTPSSQTPSSIVSSSQTSVITSKDMIINGQRVTSQLVNTNDCPTFDFVDSYTLVVNGYSSNNFIQFKAKCSNALVRTIWKDVNTQGFVSSNYKLAKYNTTNNQILNNYPANITLENGYVVTYHTIVDNTAGDSDTTVNSIWDPYTIVYTGTQTSNSSQTSNSTISSSQTLTPTIPTNNIQLPNQLVTNSIPMVINQTNNNANANTNNNNANANANNNITNLNTVSNNNLLNQSPTDSKLIRTGGTIEFNNIISITSFALLTMIYLLHITSKQSKIKE